MLVRLTCGSRAARFAGEILSPSSNTLKRIVSLIVPVVNTGMILSNGDFKVEQGSNASITGTLVTTGTLPIGEQQLPTEQNIAVDQATSQLGAEIGKLAPLTITKRAPNLTPREETLRIIFSPFRVAQDFEIRRQ